MRPPSNFRGFIGQRSNIRLLKGLIHGYRARSKPCPHLLFVGPSGMGKTRLARTVAEEYGSKCEVIHAKATPKDICGKLIELNKGDFLFLDEAHSLPRDSQEALFEVIDGNKMTDH